MITGLQLAAEAYVLWLDGLPFLHNHEGNLTSCCLNSGPISSRRCWLVFRWDSCCIGPLRAWAYAIVTVGWDGALDRC